MKRRVNGVTLAALSLLAGLAGCTDAVTFDPTPQQRVIEGADPDQAMTEAIPILQREFGRLKVDQAARHIVTTPVEFTTDRESGTARDLYHGRSAMRRTATFDVGRRAGETVARLRIDVERRDTERRAVVQPPSHRLSDTPGQETPIDRDAATTREQNAVWTRVKRDRKLEVSLLEELRERFARLTAEPAGPGGSTPPATAPAKAATQPTRQ